MCAVSMRTAAVQTRMQREEYALKYAVAALLNSQESMQCCMIITVLLPSVSSSRCLRISLPIRPPSLQLGRAAQAGAHGDCVGARRQPRGAGGVI